jgi:type II secretory ATPase GspE/PulE/Tfp pilus assembly ATPase PilB-like protein
MRDLETISTALTAAETGHLVFGTLHTQSAPSTIDRVIDVFPPHQQQQIRVQLSIALQGVMTQTLIPTADGAGRVVACEALVPTPAVRNLIREGKTHQIPSSMQTAPTWGCRRWTPRSPRSCARARSPSAPPRASPPRRTSSSACSAAWAASGSRVSTFVFKAMDLTGHDRRWEVEAESKQAVADQLKQRGMIVLDIADKKGSKEIKLAFFRRSRPTS